MARRGPNVTHFLRELNMPQDGNTAIDQADYTNFEDDMSMFANTNFFDFDSGQNTDFQPAPVNVKPELTTAAPTPAASQPSAPTAPPATPAEDISSGMGDLANFDFSIPGDLNFGDFNNYHGSTMPPFQDNLSNLQPLQPNLQPHYPASAPQQNQQQGQHNLYAQQPSIAHANGNAGPVAQPNRPLTEPYEETSRVAAEEDKRRRNTAASARFRIKKKQREQALEKSAKEMTDKVTQLESRINLLETENRWLKNLVMEKNNGNEEITAMFKEFDSKHKASKQALREASSSAESDQ